MFIYEDGPADMFLYFRGYVVGKFGDDHWISRGIDCILCVSFWVAFPIAFMYSRKKSRFVVDALGAVGVITAIQLFLERQ